MLGGTLRLVDLNLRSDLRQRVGYGVRAGAVGLALVMLFSMASAGSSLEAPGLRLMQALVHANFLAMAVFAMTTFGGAIAQERELGTLHLLYLAGVGPVAVVLGKAMSALVATVLVVAVQLPFATLAGTLGGVSPEQVLACYASLGGAAVGVVGASMLCSAVSRTARGGGRLTLVVLIAVCLLPEIVRGIGQGAAATGLAGPGLVKDAEALAASLAAGIPYPYHTIDFVFGPAFDLAIWGPAVYGPGLFGLFCLFAAWGVVEFADIGNRPQLADGGSRRARRNVWADPLAWKGFYFLVGGRLGFIARLVLVLGISFYVAWAEGGYGRTVGAAEFIHALAWVPLALVPLESLLQVARAFHAEVQDQTLSALAVLPPHRHPWMAGLVFGGMTSVAPYGAVWLLGAVLSLVSGDLMTPLAYGSAAACVYSFAFLLGHMVAWLAIRHGLGAVAIAIAAVTGLVFGLLGFAANDALGLFTVLGLLGWPVYLVYVDRIRGAFVRLVRDTAARG